MGAVADRIAAAIDRRGVGITIGATAHTVVLHVPTGSEMSLLLDDTEMQAVLKPALSVTFKASAVVAVNNTFTYDGRTFTIRKLLAVSTQGETVCKLAICS